MTPVCHNALSKLAVYILREVIADETGLAQVIVLDL